MKTDRFRILSEATGFVQRRADRIHKMETSWGKRIVREVGRIFIKNPNNVIPMRYAWIKESE